MCYYYVSKHGGVRRWCRSRLSPSKSGCPGPGHCHSARGTGGPPPAPPADSADSPDSECESPRVPLLLLLSTTQSQWHCWRAGGAASGHCHCATAIGTDDWQCQRASAEGVRLSLSVPDCQHATSTAARVTGSDSECVPSIGRLGVWTTVSLCGTSSLPALLAQQQIMSDDFSPAARPEPMRLKKAQWLP